MVFSRRLENEFLVDYHLVFGCAVPLHQGDTASLFQLNQKRDAEMGYDVWNRVVTKIRDSGV